MTDLRYPSLGQLDGEVSDSMVQLSGFALPDHQKDDGSVYKTNYGEFETQYGLKVLNNVQRVHLDQKEYSPQALHE